MKKNLTIIFLVVVILVSFYYIYKKSGQREEIVVEEKNLPVILNENEELVTADSFETKVLNPNNAYVKFDVRYPSFKKADDNFNLEIENVIKGQIDEHMVISKDSWQARYDTQTEGENIKETPEKEEDKFAFFSHFEIIQSNSTYISFVLKYGGFSGGAHGYENIVSYNYDVKNQKIINLKDLFSNDKDYLKILSDQSRVQLKKQFTTISEEEKKSSDPEALKESIKSMIEMIESGTEQNEENFKVFTFTPDKIKIYFGQYQVGPYAIGMPEVEIDKN